MSGRFLISESTPLAAILRDPVVGRALQLAHQHEARLIFVHAVEGAIPGDGLPVSFDAAALRAIVERNAADQIK